MHYLTLTPSEHFRMHGTLPDRAIEDLLVEAAKTDVLDDIGGYIDEAKGCYLGEDFADKRIGELKNFAKRLRGDNKSALLTIIEELEGEVKEAKESGNYGYDELKKALALIEQTR